MNKKVTKLIDNISLCRDLVTKSEKKEVLSKIYVFELVTNEVQRQVKKWLNDNSYELDFMAGDLFELSNEIHNYIKDFNFSYDYMQSAISKFDVIDDKVINDFTLNIADLMYIDRKLREAYKILAYMGLVYTLWEKRNEG